MLEVENVANVAIWHIGPTRPLAPKAIGAKLPEMPTYFQQIRSVTHTVHIKNAFKQCCILLADQRFPSE